MEAVVIGAFLNTCLPKLWEVIAEGHGLRLQIKGDIDYIEEELPSLDACIGKHMPQCTSPGSEVSEIIKKARRLAEDTEQCISQFLLYQAHGHHRWKMSHVTFAAKISAFRAKLDAIKADFSSLGQGPTIGPVEPPDLHFDEQPFVGMGVPIEELVELLGCVMPEKPTTKIGKGKLKVISIVGIGGSGKTRLADKVYQIAGNQFGRRSWVRMGLARNVQEVLHDIRTDLELVHNGASTSTGIQQAQQRNLIVIDDVRMSTDDWHTLMEALPDSDVGSRIIVTTRSQAVAEHCSSHSSYVYKMSTLCYDDSVKLFTSSVTGKISPARTEQLSKLIKTCDGLPLALIESAKSLPRMDRERIQCQEAARNLCVPGVGSNGTLTRMQWVLMNNYNGLTNNGARACLLYFHMFTFDNVRKRKFLIRRWLAEGLVQRNGRTCSDLDAASNHLKTLNDGNIIRSMQVSNNTTVKSCRLLGTIHQFISCQSMSQDFVTFLRSGDVLTQPKRAVRRLSLHHDAADSTKYIDGVDVSLLRTLAISGKACEAILDFPQYELLRVLDLKEWDYHQLDRGQLQDKLKDICKLVMLKYLGLPGSIGEVPRKIKHLELLETLDLGETAIVKVYGEVVKLPRLKHLIGKFRLFTLDTPENWVPKESRLETFSGFVTNGRAAFPKLMKYMKQLKKVKMWCDFKGEDKELKDLSAAIKEYISRTGPIDLDRSLSIDVTGCEVQFLESLKADPGNLTKLKLHGRLHQVPEFLTRQIDGLTELCLSLTTLCGKRSLFPFPLKPGATLLPSLTYLKLVEDDLGPLKIQDGIIINGKTIKTHFPSLERICLVGNKSINGITIEAGALEFLVSLHIMCKDLDGLAGIDIGGLESLEEIALDSEVSQTTKDAWKVAARGHPNKPRVLFIEADPTT